MEKGEAGTYKGKKPDDLDVKLDENLLDDVESSDDDEDGPKEENTQEKKNVEMLVSECKRKDIELKNQASTSRQVTVPKKTMKPKLVPWTAE